MGAIQGIQKGSQWGSFGVSSASGLLDRALGLATQEMSNRNNFKWGEKAAEADQARQMEMYERMYQDQSPVNVVKQLDAAGLSKSLMFSGGAGGVGGSAKGATGTKNPFSGASAQQGQNLAITAAQLENMKANTELTRAQQLKTEAETVKTGEETTTITATREAITNKLIGEGHGLWLKNFQEQYKMDTPKEGENKDYTDPNKGYYGNQRIDEKSLFTREISNNLAKTEAEAGNANATALLTNEKAKGYWTELLNDTTRADSAKIQATATKLSQEFSTGEQTNWKTWADMAFKLVGMIK